MSWADVAASGPQQTDEEKRAPPVVQLEEHDSSTSSLIDVDSPHISSVTSDYREQEVKTETQAERMEQEAEAETRKKAAKAEKKAEEVKNEAASKAEELKKETASKAEELKKETASKAEELKKKGAAKAKDAKQELKKDAKKFDENKDNPVFIGNYILWTITAAAVGYGAYQKHSEGKLDLNVVGTAALGLGALGAVDYFASKWLVENKYPTK